MEKPKKIDDDDKEWVGGEQTPIRDREGSERYSRLSPLERFLSYEKVLVARVVKYLECRQCNVITLVSKGGAGTTTNKGIKRASVKCTKCGRSYQMHTLLEDFEDGERMSAKLLKLFREIPIAKQNIDNSGKKLRNSNVVNVMDDDDEGEWGGNGTVEHDSRKRARGSVSNSPEVQTKKTKVVKLREQDDEDAMSEDFSVNEDNNDGNDYDLNKMREDMGVMKAQMEELMKINAELRLSASAYENEIRRLTDRVQELEAAAGNSIGVNVSGDNKANTGNVGVDDDGDVNVNNDGIDNVEDNGTSGVKKSYAQAARDDTRIASRKKDVARVKKFAEPRKEAQIFKKALVFWNPDKVAKSKGRHHLIYLAWRFLEGANVNYKVHTISLRGNSVIELYIPGICYDEVLNEIAKAKYKYEVNVEEKDFMEKNKDKVINRLCNMLLRAKLINLKQCILSGFDPIRDEVLNKYRDRGGKPFDN